MKQVYLTRMGFVKYDDEHYLLYLGEQKIDNYQPGQSDMAGSQGDGSAADASSGADTGVTAYSYEGTEPDGSTKVQAKEATYDAFTAGLVRSRYTQDQVEAILCNRDDGDSVHLAEYNALQAWRSQAKEMAKEVLGRLAGN